MRLGSRCSKECLYANCVKLPVAVFPRTLPNHVTRETLERESVHFNSLIRLESISSDDLGANITLAHFLTRGDGKCGRGSCLSRYGTQSMAAFGVLHR